MYYASGPRQCTILTLKEFSVQQVQQRFKKVIIVTSVKMVRETLFRTISIRVKTIAKGARGCALTKCRTQWSDTKSGGVLSNWI